LITKRSPSVVVVGRLIDAHSRLTRELSAQLVAAHRLTLSEYEVLMLLARAPDGAMRRVDLAHEACLSPSGVTRMLDRLEGAGLVAKRECREDARVTYAALTEAGLAKLERCAPDHVAAIERLLGERFDGHEVDSLVELLGRLSAPGGQTARGG
jgi:MarR family 2-MHQ and catechol resistance regulon transcriptional repressor